MEFLFRSNSEIKAEGIELSSATLKAVWHNCLVCGDRGSGKHYGIVACEGCKGFFKRSIRKNLNYSCQGGGACPVDKVHRNRCQRCRLIKCLTMGMKKEAVQCERKPITKFMKNCTQEDHLPNSRSSPSTNHQAAIYHEKTEHQLITSSTISFPSTPTSPLENCLSSFISGEDGGSIISSEHLRFKLKPPTLGVSTLSMDYVYEIATRLLFLTVDWARSIQAFCSLDSTDQLVLLQSTWSDLFMLGVAQCSSSFPMSPLLTLAAFHVENDEAGDDSQDGKSTALNGHPSLVDKIMMVKELLFSLEKLELDPVEYAFLKAIVLFNSDCSSLKNPKQVERLQEKAHCSLKLYVENKHPNFPERFAKLLLRLPGTRVLTQRTAEELFFSPLIGTVRIESIMNNILSNSLPF